jgi:surface carbohydrate biosynthesis protein
MVTRRPGTRPRVAMVVDHPRRDLAGLVLTAMDLCGRGADVQLVPLNLQEPELWALAPDLVLLNYARPGNDDLARHLLDAGIRIGVLDTEGGAWEDCRAYSGLLWRDRALLKELSFACMWGPRLADHVVAEGLLGRRQIAVTGCPRFDFYAPTWRGVFGDRPAAARPLLLINTSFSGSNPRFTTPARNRERLQRELGMAPDRLEAYLAAEREAVAGMAELARNLARDFPGCEIVLRPHPFENPAPYLDALSGLPGVAVEGGGPVQPWIFRAAAVIQRSCSTAIEAALAGVPALSPQWIPAPAVVSVAEAVSIPCGDYAALAARLRDIVATGGARPREAPSAAASELLSDWFFRCDGLSHHRVGEVVSAHLPASRTVNDDRCRRRMYGIGPGSARMRQRAAARARYLLRLSPTRSFRRGQTPAAHRWDQSDKRFTVTDVQALVSSIHAAMRRQGREVHPVAIASTRDVRLPHGGDFRSVMLSAGN